MDVKLLYRQRGYADEVRLERWRPGASPGVVGYPGGAEIFVLRGDLSDEAGRYETGDWLRLPAGAAHEPSSDGGCTFYIKRGGVRYLLDASAPAEATTD
jgi:anti-sigma factor ChrR (cupin superfamily)